jgi:DNA-binding response OmpR family regulator
MKILLIEDDELLIALLTRSLSSQHHIVDAVKDGEMGWTYASTFDYDLIILDIMLPKLDGISLCQKLRREGYTTPILLLTAQDNTTAKVQGLDAGADDYMVKPFDPAELIARVRALLRRGSGNPLPLLSWGDLMLDTGTCAVSYNGQRLTLTTKEYDLLELLLRDSAHIFSSDEIIDRLWSSDEFPAEATVRSHLRRLRHKLQAAGAPPDTIGTIHGRGYYLKSPQSHPKDNSVFPKTSGSEGTLMSPADVDLHTDGSLQFNQQQQYLSFLQETWVATKPQCLDRVTELSATVDRLRLGACSHQDLHQAHQQAHKLVGTLGVFSLQSAMEIAREIESLLTGIASVPEDSWGNLCFDSAAETLPLLLHKLAREIEDDLPSQKINLLSSIGADSPEQNLPLLILVDLDPTLSNSLTTIAKERGCRTIALPSIEAAHSYLSTIPNRLPTVLLVRRAADRGHSTTSHPLFSLIDNVRQQFPDWSVLVLGERDESILDRLAVVRQGGKFIDTNTLTAAQIFASATSLLHSHTTTVKIMVVDDDLDWLRALPKLLQPWGLNVTTLADPQQFWTVLQVVKPEALVLDIKMPEINGLELCQVLRSDPHWQHLPILFLSATNDPLSQQAAFSVGADDYLCKPIGGGELAGRIRHRLARLQSGHAELSST